MKLGLMILDLQKEYYKGYTKESMDDAVDYINEVIPYFRKMNWPIIWIQDINEEDGVILGAESFEFIDSLKPEEGDYRIHKSYSNSFNKTDLTDILKKHSIETVVLSGFCAEYCVLSTYHGAQDHDFTPIMLQNGLASLNKDNLHFVERICDQVSYTMLSTITKD